MKLLILVLNKINKLEDLLAELMKAGICGATVLTSTGMARVLTNRVEEDIPFFGSIRAMLNPERDESRTIFAVLPEDQIQTAIEIIESVIGNLSAKDTGIVFSLPVDFSKGLSKFES